MNNWNYDYPRTLKLSMLVILLALFGVGEMVTAAELSFGPPRQITDGEGGYHPRWSPDGTQIAYVAGNWPDIKIYLVPATGGERTLIPIDRVGDLSLSWHPSGQKIFFDGYKDGTETLAIYEVDLDSGAVSRLTNLSGGAFGPSCSFDGQRIAFSYSGNIYSLAANGSNLSRHTSHASFDWYQQYSPDGSMLTFSSDRTGNGDVWILDIDSGALTQFTNDPGMDSRSVFSPDAAWIAWTSDRTGSRQVYVKPVEGGDTIQIGADQEFSDAGMPDWCPDGTGLCFVGDGQIWAVDIEGITGSQKTTLGGFRAMFR